MLHEAYNEVQGGAYVILVYRDSSDAHKSKDRDVTKDRLIRHCRHFISSIYDEVGRSRPELLSGRFGDVKPSHHFCNRSSDTSSLNSI
jgi:hypothetical protein